MSLTREWSYAWMFPYLQGSTGARTKKKTEDETRASEVVRAGY